MAFTTFELGFLGLFVLVGVVLFLGGIGSLWVGYRIRRAEPDRVTDAVSGGSVDLEGTAAPHEETLEAPFTGRECIGYEYEVEEYHHDDDGSNWQTKDRGEVLVPFLLEDSDGTVLVRTDGVNIDIDDDRERIQVAGGEEPPQKVREFIEGNEHVNSENKSLDLKITEVSYGDRRRYTEHVLLPGETTYVSGVARPPSHADTRIPRDASAVVGPPESDGVLERARQKMSPLSFLVSDAPMAEAAKRRFVSGVVLTGAGVLFAGIPAFIFSAGG